MFSFFLKKKTDPKQMLKKVLGEFKLPVFPEVLFKALEAIKDPKCNFKVGMDSCLFSKISNIRELTDVEKVFGDTCEASRCSSYISADMKFMPCSFADHDAYGFPLDKVNINKIWNNGDAFKEAREKLLKEINKCPYGL